MPIRINLLAEQQMAEEMRRRNPVKLACWLGGFLVALVLLYSLSLKLKRVLTNYDVDLQQKHWRALETNNIQILNAQAKTRIIEQKIEALSSLCTNRFLWGSALNGLQFAMVDKIQLTRIRVSQTYTPIAEVKPKPNDKTKPQPARARENIRLVVDGKDFGPPGGEQIELFKRSLVKTPFLNQFLTNENQIHLISRGQPQEDAQTPGRSFVFFSLECGLLDIYR
jgi:hypothetical protein